MNETGLPRQALESVYTIAKALASTLDPDPLLELILEAAMTHIPGAERGTIHLLDDRGESLLPRVSSVYGTDLRPSVGMKAGTGIAGRAVAEKTTLYVPDTRQDPHFVRLTGDSAAVRSLLSAALVADDEALGALSISSPEPGAFDQRARELLTALASLAAIALKNARLYASLQQRVQELQGLYEVSQTMSDLAHFEDAFGRLAERMARLVGAEACIIGLYDPQTHELRAQTPAFGLDEALVREVRYPAAGEAKAFWNFRTQGALVANAVEEMAPSLRPLARRLGVHNVLVVPMLREGRVLGLIYVANKAVPLTQEDAQLLSILAGQAAVVLENVQLVADLTSAKRELEEWSRELEARVEARTAELGTAQQQLLEAQRRATIADLGARMAHELRHPMGVLSNAIFLLRSYYGAREGPPPEKYLELMGQQLERADRIVEGLLTFAERRRPEPGPVPVAEAVATTLSGLSRMELIQLQRDVPVDLSILGSQEELRLVLEQLLTNAVEALPEGGGIRILARADGERVRLEIEDSGPGIPHEDLERVFQPLYTTKAFGLGLGLPLARNLVEVMGGHLELSSRPGRGTKVVLSLPRA